MPKLSAAELARMIDGRVRGSEDVQIANVTTLEGAGPDDLAFLRDKGHKDLAEASSAGIVISSVELDAYGGTLVVCEDADVAMAEILPLFAAERSAQPEGISDLASVSPDAELGADVAVGDFAYVGPGAVLDDGAVVHPHAYVGAHCRIGERTVIGPHACIHDGVQIGRDCIVHYSAVIGSEGFGFVQRGKQHVKLAQVGTVRVGDRVDIGALTTIDRALIDETVIEDGVKIDNHCHIAHNCHVGEDCILAGYSKLAGSVVLEKGVIVAENAGVNDHVHVGEGAILGASCGVPNDVAAGAIMLGTPARPIGVQRRIFAFEARLPEMAKRLRQLEKQVEAIESALPDQG